MNNPFPPCCNCVHEDVPTQESPCAECQAAFLTDRTKPLFKSKWPKTNADRFRAMTDEELASELLSLFAAFYEVEWSREAILEWLKQEVDA